MHNRFWKQPVELRTHMGDLRRITSSAEAALFLRKYWPSGANGQPVRGQLEFLSALESAVSVAEARAIFTAACISLGMTIVESSRPETPVGTTTAHDGLALGGVSWTSRSGVRR